MLINFNIERLDRLLWDFYRITGLTVSVWDAKFNMLAYQPKEMSGFCRKIREFPEGKRRCYLSDKAVCGECKKTGQPATHMCHAGLIDSAVPIKYQDEILGFMMFGQAIGTDKKSAYPKIKKLSADLGIKYDMLIDLYEELDIYDEEKISAAANILKMSARYLWLSEYIEIKRDKWATLIEEFVINNLSSELSVSSICQAVGVTKNRLYKTSHDSFGMTIGDYVAAMRIKEAKQLLVSTAMPISEICQRIGVCDYNYFSKFFKAHTGVSPTKFRKEYPFGIL